MLTSIRAAGSCTDALLALKTCCSLHRKPYGCSDTEHMKGVTLGLRLGFRVMSPPARTLKCILRLYSS